MKKLNTLAIAAACSTMAFTAPVVAAETFSIKAGGRIMLDAALVDSDEDLTITNNSGSEFRRTRFFLKGKGFDGWGYKLQIDFAQDGSIGYEDVYLTKKLGGGKLWIGHYHLPFGMEELQSSKYTDFMERSMISGALDLGRQRAVGYSWNNDQLHWSGSVFSQENNISTTTTPAGNDERLGYAGRIAFAPVKTDTNVIYLGAAVAGFESNSAVSRLRYRTNYHVQTSRPTLTVAGTTDSPVQFGLEFAGAWGPMSIKSEYMNLSADGEGGAADVDADGLYVSGTYTFGYNVANTYSLQSGGVFGRIKGQGIWQVGARVDTATLEQGATEIESTSVTLGGTYIANPYLRFKGEVVFAESEQNGVDTQDETIVQVRTQIDF